ncbi:MAG: hypothetical protein WCK49_08225 [Myxococcaceae bacterium]
MKKILVLLFLLTLSLHAQVGFMDQAKNATLGVMEAIKAHPFLLEIANGTLSKSRFDYYSKQDKIYDWRYANSLLGLARKAPRVDLKKFLITAANDTTAYWEGPPPLISKQCKDCSGYSDFEEVSVDRSFAQGLASIAPCYVVYWTIGNWLKQISVPNNPYQEWIEGNSSPHYGTHVMELENFINEIASNVTKAEESEMLETYLRSTEYEWYFWNSAYKESTWEQK